MGTAKINRREFAKAGTLATAALGVLHPGRVLGANQRIRLGFIGLANRGGQLLDAFEPHADAEVAALCDVSRSTLDRASSRLGGKAATYGDFRKLLDAKDIDAVVIATPDHWHAVQSIMACRAGKDVYVEKPLSITVFEGRRMVEVARQTKRIVQVGIHRRSSEVYARAAQMIQGDKLGKVTVSRCYHLSNMYPAGIGKSPPGPPPADLDWDLWLGPRPPTSLSGDDRPLQIPLVGPLFVAGGQPGSALPGCHPLDDRRAGPGIDLRHGRPFRRGRRPRDSRHDGSHLPVPDGPAGDLRAVRGQRQSGPGARRLLRTPRHPGDGLRRRRDRAGHPRTRRPVPGPRPAHETAGDQARVRRFPPAAAKRISRLPPSTRATSSIACDRASSPIATWRSGTVRPPSACWPIFRWPRRCGWNGMPSESKSPIARRPTNCSTMNIASRGRWTDGVGTRRGRMPGLNGGENCVAAIRFAAWPRHSCRGLGERS